MATPNTFDVWLTASNRVYRAVPYEVLADWAQQGRVRPDDRVRPAGGGDWLTIVESSAFAAYLPRAVPAAAEDRAEALEPVDFDIPPLARRLDDDDDDVDMIPLIDISLVLLIFFMMTATVAVSGADIPTPKTYHGIELTQSDASTFWIGVDLGEGGKPLYSLGQGDRPSESADRGLTREQVLARLDARLKTGGRGALVRVAAHKKTPFGTIKEIAADLEQRRKAGKITEIKAEMNQGSS